MTTQPKNKGGRPRKPEAEKFEQRSARLTPAQWAKVDAHGGQEWLRQVVEHTDLPALPTKKPAK
jgi:hypothetical protein